MTIDEQIISLIKDNNSLNKKQLDILGIEPKDRENFENIIISKDITKNHLNLLILLSGISNIKDQERVINNYHKVFEYNNIKAQVYKNPQKNQDFHKILEIYCDGACKKNPGFSGSGIVIYKNDIKPILLYGDFIENGTNNIAELNALIKSLQIAKEHLNYEQIIIYSDSEYSINSISKWAYSWKQNNWTKKGGDIKNLDLIIKAHTLFDTLKEKVSLQYVKGHNKIEGNELADKMANYSIIQKNSEYEELNYNTILEVLNQKEY